MKKIETFEGVVNGKKFTSREAMDNYLKDLKEDINEYRVSSTVRYADDDELIEDKVPAVEEEDESQTVPAPPMPYVDPVQYIVPTIEELDSTENVVRYDSDAINRVEQNLSDRMEYFINNIEALPLNHPILDNISDASYESANFCKEKIAECNARIKDINEELKRTESIKSFYDTVGGYLSTIQDAI